MENNHKVNQVRTIVFDLLFSVPPSWSVVLSPVLPRVLTFKGPLCPSVVSVSVLLLSVLRVVSVGLSVLPLRVVPVGLSVLSLRVVPVRLFVLSLRVVSVGLSVLSLRVVLVRLSVLFLKSKLVSLSVSVLRSRPFFHSVFRWSPVRFTVPV